MKKKTINDIRLYKSESKNENGGYITEPFADKKLNVIVTRIVMKLRESEFSLGEFDHLYINFTTCDMVDELNLSDEVDRYHPWYRCCSIRIEKDLYNKLGDSETWDCIIQSIRKVLVTFFSSDDFDETRILSCVHQAVEQGNNMLMKYKEKAVTKRKAVIFLRLLDDCRFYPLLRVYDADNNLILEKNLPKTVTLDYIGEIQVGLKRVTIKPKKSVFSKNKSPLAFEY